MSRRVQSSVLCTVEGVDGGLDKLRELLSAEEEAAEAEAEPAAEDGE